MGRRRRGDLLGALPAPFFLAALAVCLCCSSASHDSMRATVVQYSTIQAWSSTELAQNSLGLSPNRLAACTSEKRSLCLHFPFRIGSSFSGVPRPATLHCTAKEGIGAFQRLP